MNIFSILIGIALGIAFYILFAGLLRKFWIALPAEPNPEDIEPVDLHYRCSVCGAEVTMTMAPNSIEVDAPRHCREDMLLTTSN